MFQSLKQYPLLFKSIFFIPLFFHIVVWQLSMLKESWMPGIPVRICLLILGIVWGGASGVLSTLVTLLLFNVFPKWKHLRKESVMYAICWLAPFCYMTLFGAAMANDGPPVAPIVEIQRGLGGLAMCGLIGGACGFMAFAATQLPGFRSRFAFPVALLMFLGAYYIKEGWQLPVLQSLPHVPMEIAIYPTVEMILGAIIRLTVWWMALLICWTVVSWLQKTLTRIFLHQPTTPGA